MRYNNVHRVILNVRRARESTARTATLLVHTILHAYFTYRILQPAKESATKYNRMQAIRLIVMKIQR